MAKARAPRQSEERLEEEREFPDALIAGLPDIFYLARLDFALKAAGMGVWDWNITAGKVSWSEGWARLYALEEGFDGAQDEFMALIHPDDRERVAEAIRRALADDQDYAVEHRVLRKDGSLRWIASIGDVLRGARGEPLRMSGIALDITERKEAEEERERLLQSEHQARVLAETAGRRLSFLAEASTVLASSLDYEATLDSVARLAVPSMADWCAIDILDEAGGLQRLALQHVDPSKVAFGRELQSRYPPDLTAERGIARVLRTGEAEFYPEISEAVLEAAAQDAEHLDIIRRVGMRSALIVPLEVRGRAIGAITFVLAESERLYHESDLELAEELARRASVAVDNARLFAATQDLNESLEQRVMVRTEQLERINQELEAFAYAVSHDLRTPLSGIDGFSQALVEDYGDSLDETAGYYLERIQFNTRRMGQLIDDILKLSRVSRHELRLESVDLSKLAVAVAEGLRGHYPNPHLFRCEGGLVAEGDRGLLRIALENLLDNAWKFSSLSDQALVAFGRTEGDGEAAYFVRDTGAGFDMDYAHQLFQPFRRLHTEAAFTGTGIGLVTVKRIVERHGGRIWAKAEAGKGATFFFTLDAGKMVDRSQIHLE
ncbi:MAG: PAS domain-containing protein [Deinococcota bacterium]|nr:PAS domain-containing protein [Deinococcota bacterium]